MAVNRNWVKTDGKSLEYAPTWLRTDAGIVVNPSDEQYLAAGWKRNAVQPPELLDGMVVVSTSYEVHGDSIVAVYDYAEVTPPPPMPKRYSKKKFSLALARRGIFVEFEEWAKSTEVIEGSGLTIARVLADSWFMQSDDPEFIAVKGVAESKFGVNKIAEVLSESEDEEW